MHTDFDPTYGYNLQQLLSVLPPTAPDGFTEFWRGRYLQALGQDPSPSVTPSSTSHPDFECFELSYLSTDAFKIVGWVLVPKIGSIKRGVVIGHGYDGRDRPDFEVPITDAAFLFPCFRGLSRSRCDFIADDPALHVLHNINDREHYLLGGCVDDVWLGVSALLQLFPETAGHIGYMGSSFGGGVGALALACDKRIQRAHLHVPSFGHQALRLQLPSWGSAAALQAYWHDHCSVLTTLSYYDAAIAAQTIQIPVHVAAALYDPIVAPPCQFSIYNALQSEKHLFVLEQGHSNYPGQEEQQSALADELTHFFSPL